MELLNAWFFCSPNLQTFQGDRKYSKHNKEHADFRRRICLNSDATILISMHTHLDRKTRLKGQHNYFSELDTLPHIIRGQSTAS